MSAKAEFIKYVEDLMSASKDTVTMPDNVRLYWQAFCSVEEIEKPLFTENGRLILNFLQQNIDTPMWKAKDIANGLEVSSRMVGGSIRKLVTDGYVEKMSQEPVIYALTEKGKNIVIDI